MRYFIPVAFNLTAIASYLTAIGIPIWQTFIWLRTAEWPRYPIPFSPPYGDWEGVNRLMDFVWILHPSVPLLLAGWIIGAVGHAEHKAVVAFEENEAAGRGQSQ